MRKITVTTLAIGAIGALAGTLLAAGPSTGSPGSTADARSKSGPYVDFALKASGFGSHVVGGQVPAGSAHTAFDAISCTTRPGVVQGNHEAEVTIPGLGKVSAVKTSLWTTKSGGTVSSYARNTIGNIVIAQSGMGRLELKAITALAHSFHDARGFHAETTTSVGGLRFVPTGGPAMDLDLPTPGRPIEIPGLAKVMVGASQKRVNADGAKAQANALLIKKTVSGTKVAIGQAKAQVLDGVEHGTFHGFSAGTEARGLADNLTSGRTPLALMPCQGTDGKVLTQKLASVNLGSNLDVGAVQTQQMGDAKAAKAVAWERGSVAGINIGNGQLVVDAIVGKVTVTREGRNVKKSFTGSTVGRVTANGEVMEFPDTGVIEVPGIAKIERFVKDTKKNGASIIALRVTLLDGTGAVIDLGQAAATIRPH